MPFFDFKCSLCEHVQEILCSFEASELEFPCLASKDCTGTMLKQLCAPVGIHAKGPGCYNTEKGK